MCYRLKFDPDKCVGCYACHIACLDAHHDVEDVDAKSHRTVKKVVKNQFEKNICPGCAHCGICIKACPVQAIYKDPKTGFVLTDKEKCIGCHACEKVCPKDVIHFDKDGKWKSVTGVLKESGKGGNLPASESVFPVRSHWNKDE